MKKIICLKCNTEMKPGKINTPAGPIWILKGKLTIFSGNRYQTYACLKCGFMESYLNLKTK